MNISDWLKETCLRYYHFLWHRWKGEDVQTNGMLDLLPGPLKAEFCKATFGKMFGKVIEQLVMFCAVQGVTRIKILLRFLK